MLIESVPTRVPSPVRALLGLMALLALGLVLGGASLASAANAAEASDGHEGRQLLWGDTHLHTSYSFDAFLNGNRTADPDTAFRWAKGLPVIHPYHRARVQVKQPLDFLVVADHAEYFGVIRQLYFDVHEGPAAEFANHIREAFDSGEGAALFAGVLPKSELASGSTVDPIADEAGSPTQLPIPAEEMEALRQNAWALSTATADRHNEPGKFTALIGWEWSSLPNGANLHRVVITSASGEEARRFMPYGSDQSSYPKDLWAWLEDTTEKTGSEFVAIPHNSNISKGYMWGENGIDGTPYTAESAWTRARWEPVAEVTQFKGDSEAHPALSPDDPFADFEEYPFYIQQNEIDYKAQVGDYARSALRRGLEIDQRIGANPYKFGMIGATDSHTGLSSYEEDNFWGKMALDSTPETKDKFAAGRGVTGWNMGAGGLAGVWADGNTRDAIFAAFRRREVYATTGSRMKVRFFGGWDFSRRDLRGSDMAEKGYEKGVPMGGDLAAPKSGGLFAGDPAPHFLIQAVKDPMGANLDRAQVVKGWVDASGASHEKIYDVVWSGDREIDANGMLPPVGDTVDLETGAYTNDIGAAELAKLWVDPDFDASQRAFYYVRVLEIPTPRHSLLDAIALQQPAPSEAPATLQERAYTSPIWYTP